MGWGFIPPWPPTSYKGFHPIDLPNILVIEFFFTETSNLKQMVQRNVEEDIEIYQKKSADHLR